MANKNSAGYIPYYGQTGFGPVPPKLGFVCDVNIMKKDNFEDIKQAIAEADYVGIDTETTSLEWDSTELISVQISVPGNKNWIGFYFRGYFTPEQTQKLCSDEQLDELVKLALQNKRCFMWNRYFDQRVLMHTREFNAFDFHTCYDGMDLLWWLDTNVKQGLSLKNAGTEFLGIKTELFENVFEGDIKLANWKDLARYGCLDSYITVEMGMLLYPIFVKHYSFLLKLHLNFKNALFDLENQPLYIDREKLDSLYFEINQEIEEVKAEFFNKYGTINLGSNKQKSDLLFRLGYSTGKMNKPAKDGSPIMSVKDEYLQELWKKQDCDAARLMITYNKLIKLNSSYIEATKEFMDAGYTPRFHYLDSRVPTGRLACGKYSIKRKPYLYFLPINGQALPKNKSILREVEVDLSKSFEFKWVDEQTDTSICVETQSPHLNYRTVLTAAPGCYLVRADFSAEEIYVAAGVSQEPNWVQAMRDELDLHKATASAMFNVPYDEVDGNMRDLAKTCNFGLLYGGNEYTMHSRFGTSLDEARAFIKTYESGLPTLYRWKAIEAQKARTSGFVRNEFGHERRLQYYFKSKDYRISGRDGFAERSTWNSIIQGSCGIIMRLALFKCWKSIYYPGGRWYKSGVEFIITVHDEVDFSVPEEHMAEFIPWIKWTLESCTPPSLSRLGLHLKVGLEYGKNFGETIPINAVWDKGDSYQKEFDPEGWTFHVDSSKRDEPKSTEEIEEESKIKDEEVEDETYEEVNGFAF